MTEPARKITTTPQGSSSLGRANLSLIQGGGSSFEKKNKNQPTLHPLSQTALARELHEDQERDRNEGNGDSGISDDTLSTEASGDDGGSVLELEPQSYTVREQTPEMSEAKRQRQMARMGARFIRQGGVASEGNGESVTSQAPSRQRSSFRPSRRTEEQQAQQQFAQEILSGRRQAALQRVDARSGIAESGVVAEEAQEMAQETRRLYALITKIIELESVVLIIWVLIALNIETWNIVLFRKKLPSSINNGLNKIGLNIDVNPAHPWTPVNKIVVGLTVLVDMLITIFVLMQLAFFLFVMYLIIKMGSVLGIIGISP